MRNLLLITTALVCLAAPADAGPVVALVANGVGLWTAVGAVYGTVAAVIGQMALSYVLSAVAMKLSGSGKVKQADVIRELQQPTSLPVWRYVYGKGWAPGTPAPVRVRGVYIYGCWILNSRPSEGPFTVYLDKREVTASGNPYDFGGPGATATNAPFAGHLDFWIGRGDQVAPPAAITDAVPDLFEVTDGWQGLTVIWMRINVGDNGSRSERWPATPPEVMVDGLWSRVWDPRDPEQDAADPATWLWSANQALCTLDALRTNPLRPHDDRHLWLETFAWAADVADQPVPVRGGGTIPRYEANGVLVWAQGAEIEDQVQPLADAGAARFTRSGGVLGLIPGIWREPTMVLSDVLDDQPMQFQRWRASDDLVTAVTATYVSPDRAYEEATTPVWTIPGAQAEDGGPEKLGQYELRFVTDHRQAQRVARIMGMRTRMQRALSAVFPPSAFDLVGGSIATLDLPAPWQRRNGTYEVEEAGAVMDPIGQEGVALRCPLGLREITPAVYAWDPEIDEQEVTTEDWDATISGIGPPESLTIRSNAETVVESGNSLIAQVVIRMEKSLSPSVNGYEWQFSTASDDNGPIWLAGGVASAAFNGFLGRILAQISPAIIGQDYLVRARALSPRGTSIWVTAGPIVASTGEPRADPPTAVSAIGGDGEIAVTFQAPNSPQYAGMEIFAGSSPASWLATLFAGPVFGGPNSVVTEIETGLGTSVTRYYFARSIDTAGVRSALSAPISATTNP